MPPLCGLYEGLPVVFRNERGVVVYWFRTDRNTRVMYRVFYFDGRSPLATNTMDIAHQELRERKPKEKDTPPGGQLSLF